MANSKRKCALKSCGHYFRPADGIVGPKVAFCTFDHLRQKNNEDQAKLRVRKEKQESVKRTKEFKNNDYSHQFNLTKKAAQKLANRLDNNLECISCGCARTVQFCGGHYRTVGAHRNMALDLRNIHGQCNRRCNLALSGNIGGTKSTRGFLRGLVERYGQPFVDFLESEHPEGKRTCEELIALRALYAAEIRHIEKHGSPSRDWRKI